MRYALRGEAIAAARGYLSEVSRQCDAALERLKSFIEGPD